MKRGVLPAPSSDRLIEDYGAQKGRRSRRILVRISSSLKERLTKAVSEDAYGPRGVSRWVREAFIRMVCDDPNLETLGLGDEQDSPHDDRLELTVPRNSHFVEELRDTALSVRIGAPMIEGPQSLLIRSAVRYRLNNPTLFSGS